MYSEMDLDGAVSAGALSPAAAETFRNYVATSRSTPPADEESFRLLSGFNDIFVSIALILSLGAVWQIGWRVTPPLGGASVAIAAWFGAEFFTRKRRMALPSILLLLAFVGGIGGLVAGFVQMLAPPLSDRGGALILAGSGVVAAGAAWLHWRRFMVPITVAAGALSLVGVAFALVLAAVPAAKNAAYPILLVAGIAVFALAMWWDVSDRERRTRRSDVAFWLHLAAAPLIAHPVFQLLGVFGNQVDIARALIVVTLYLFFAFVALAVDRRALLVSSLAYVLYAMYALMERAGALELSAALTAFVIGSALLTLSVFWQQMRRVVVGLLGEIGYRLPPVQRPAAV